ncbi:MAG: hypothetical protein TREMPRED_000850 [Tremellales sp. Tagirdzhanova-0007]|nr:MAG: hypothetical protein TREMPRED_000850 [Tremellales sp. Tagirdzhanova-0007]
MSFAGINATQNLSFYAIPVAFVIALAPHIYAISLFNTERASGTSEYDKTCPTSQTSKVKEAKLSPNATGNFIRAEAANANGFINLPLFAGAVIAGNMARLSPATLNAATGTYLVSRVIYNLIYINNHKSNAISQGRTAVFLIGIFACMTLFVQAGNRMRLGYVSY